MFQVIFIIKLSSQTRVMIGIKLLKELLTVDKGVKMSNSLMANDNQIQSE